MVIFPNATLNKLENPQLLIEIAKATHSKAVELIVAKEIPKYYLDAEIYEPATTRKTNEGVEFVEISRYGDGFGASLFISGEQMVFVSSNHEYAPETAIAGDRETYLAPLLGVLPASWSFLLPILLEERFILNPPCGVFFFENNQWYVSDFYEKVMETLHEDELYQYKNSIGLVEDADLSYLFAHAGFTSVNEGIINDFFNEWRG